MTGYDYFEGKDPPIDDTSCDYLIIKIFNIKIKNQLYAFDVVLNILAKK